MTDKNVETAECRGCGTPLRGKPYYMGGDAYHPKTGNKAKVNHYGGFVCSEDCDRRSHLALEQSMPGNLNQKSLDLNTSRKISAKWADKGK